MLSSDKLLLYKNYDLYKTSSVFVVYSLKSLLRLLANRLYWAPCQYARCSLKALSIATKIPPQEASQFYSPIVNLRANLAGVPLP